MEITIKKKLYCLLILLAGFSLSAQTTKDVDDMYLKSIKAYRNKDYQTFLDWTKLADSLRPSHPKYTYNLAVGNVLTGHPEKAWEPLRKSIGMNGDLDFENDPDLAALKALPDFEKLLALKVENLKVKTTSSQIVKLSEKDLHPEGLVYLKHSKTWLASSIRKGKIVSFNIKNGKCADWLKDEKMYSVFALKADPDEHYLWAATNAIPEMESYDPQKREKAEILKIDIKSRKIVQRFSALGNHIFGDLAVTKNGTVYVTDSAKPLIFKIENDQMTIWGELSQKLYNLQGIAFNADESKMYVADYFSGILEIPMAEPGKKKWLQFPEGTVVKGIDGLAWHENSLIAIHNGVKPIRIIRYSLDETGEKITGFEVIDNNRPEFEEPALGAISENRFYFFANSPWNAYDKTHQLNAAKYDNPILFGFGL